MITVHHLENSRSQRVLWLLEELGLEYEIRRYARDPKTMLAPRELREVFPLGKAPIVSDGDRVFAESGAVIERFCEVYGDGVLMPPAGTTERDQVRYWLHYAEGSLMPLLLVKLIFDRTTQPPVPFFVRPVTRALRAQVESAFTAPQLRLHLDFVASELSKSDFLVGNQLTAADIQMSFPLEAGAERLGTVGRWPDIERYVQRLQSRPAYRRALERGGPYAYGPEA